MSILNVGLSFEYRYYCVKMFWMFVIGLCLIGFWSNVSMFCDEIFSLIVSGKIFLLIFNVMVVNFCLFMLCLRYFFGILFGEKKICNIFKYVVYWS